MAVPPLVRRFLLVMLGSRGASLPPGPTRLMLRGLAALFVVCAIATIGYRLSGWSWLDSIYMVMITISSVGYGEVQPVNSVPLRIITMFLIGSGYVAALIVVSGLGQMIIDGEIRKLMGVRKIMTEIKNMNRHVIICGYGRMGRQLAERLRSRHRKVVIVDSEEERIREAIEAGFPAVRGNATEEKTLQSVGIDRAATLATVVNDDATNLFITITARGLNPNLQILSRGEQQSTLNKLRQVGANHVVMTSTIGADRLSQLILRPSAAALLKNEELPAGLIEDLETIGLTLEELELQEHSPLCGSTLSEVRGRSSYSFLIVAIRRSTGEILLDPASDTELREGDSVLVLGHEEDLQQLCLKYELLREPIGEDPAEAAV